MFFELNGRYLVWASNFNSNLMSRITPSVVKNDLRAYYFLTFRNFFPVVNLGRFGLHWPKVGMIPGGIKPVGIISVDGKSVGMISVGVKLTYIVPTGILPPGFDPTGSIPTGIIPAFHRMLIRKRRHMKICDILFEVPGIITQSKLFGIT